MSLRGRVPWFVALGRKVRFVLWRTFARQVTARLDRRFEARHLAEYGWQMKLGSGPFSNVEEMWHLCPGHEWERIDWPYGRAVRRGHYPTRVTRCRSCGAPRCNSYFGPGAMSDLTENEQEGQRCTLERHHREAHDYLSGERIEVGACA